MQLISALSLTALALGFAVAIPDGYQMTDEITWSVQATRDGPYHELNGTIQQVWSQLIEINPNFEQEFSPVHVNASEPQAKLEKRDTVNCNINTESALTTAIGDGISHLRGVSGQLQSSGATITTLRRRYHRSTTLLTRLNSLSTRVNSL